MSQRFAVLGSPIAHSRSPKIHRAAYRELGLDWQYEAIECREPELVRLLGSRDDSWRGFSVTMPLKDEAYRASKVLDPVAEASGVVNTLLRIVGPQSQPVWAGFNTDVAGLAEALREGGLDASCTLVLGAGATAVSAVLAAQHLGAQEVTIAARRAEAAERLAARLGARAVQIGTAEYQSIASGDFGAGLTLVISTLPGSAGATVEIPASLTGVPLFDVAYDPWPSPLAERWRAAGGAAHSGLAMLVHQALLQLRIFVGGDPSFELEREADVLRAMRAAAESQPAAPGESHNMTGGT